MVNRLLSLIGHAWGMTHSHRFQRSGTGVYLAARLAERASSDLTRDIDLLRVAIRLAMARWPFDVRAASVLPAGLHMIWRLPEGDSDVTARWRMMTATLARHLPAAPLRAAELWQGPVRQHLIQGAEDFRACEAHCLMAPVRAGLVTRAQDWPHSSLGRRPHPAGFRRPRPGAGARVGDTRPAPQEDVLAV